VEARSLASLAGLRAGRLIRMRTGTRRGMLETYHDRIRTAVVASLDEAGVKAANLALACALEARAPRDAQALARHFEAAGILPKASGYAVRAAVQAEAALAFDQAAAFYRKAIQLKEASDPERLSLWKRLGDVLARAGLSAESAEAYLKAAEGGTETSRLRRRAAEEYLRSGNIEAGLAVLTEVLVQAGVRVPGSRTAAVISFLWHRLRLKLRGMDFVERAADQVPAGQLERVDMLWALAMGLGPVDVLRAADFQTRQLLLTLDAGEPFRVARALSHEIVLAAAGGNRSIGKTQALVARSLALAEHIGDPGPRARALVAEGIARTIQGRWRVSADLLGRAEELLTQHRTGMDYELHLAQHHRLLVLLVLGDLRLIRERLPVLLQEAREKGDLIAATNLRTSISYILSLAKDDPGEARRELEAAIGLWSRRDFHVQHYYHLVSQANIELYAGAALEAFEAMRGAEPGARRSLLLKLQPILVTTLELRARTALALAFDPPRPGAAAALVRSARRDIRRLLAERTTYGGALVMKLRAMLAVLSGRDEEALELLLRAELTFEACDMTLHAMAVRHCRGRLTGSAGTGLRESAEAWMKGQGIRNPGRLAAMHVPLPVLFGA
jgi:tetratricopeptide (TPR) repeat protein